MRDFVSSTFFEHLNSHVVRIETSFLMCGDVCAYGDVVILHAFTYTLDTLPNAPGNKNMHPRMGPIQRTHFRKRPKAQSTPQPTERQSHTPTPSHALASHATQSQPTIPHTCEFTQKRVDSTGFTSPQSVISPPHTLSARRCIFARGASRRHVAGPDCASACSAGVVRSPGEWIPEKAENSRPFFFIVYKKCRHPSLVRYSTCVAENHARREAKRQGRRLKIPAFTSACDSPADGWLCLQGIGGRLWSDARVEYSGLGIGTSRRSQRGVYGGCLERMWRSDVLLRRCDVVLVSVRRLNGGCVCKLCSGR